MPSSFDAVHYSVNTQLLLTIFLVVLLWGLYARLGKLDFFRWWAWAWTAFAAYLASASISLFLGPAWTPLKLILVSLLLVSGFLEACLLVFGCWSWRTPGQPSRRWFWALMVSSLGVAALCFTFGFRLRSDAVLSMAIRNFPRTFFLAAALLYCALVFFRQARGNKSWASFITGVFCLSYAFNQSFYSLTFAESLAVRLAVPLVIPFHHLAGLEIMFHSRFLFLDLLNTCGICLGMIFLLLERDRETEQELQASERRTLGLAVDNVSLQVEIQEHHSAEIALRLSEERSRQFVLNSPVAMLVARGPQQTIELANDKFVALFGYTTQDVSNVKEWWPLAYPDESYRREIQSQWQVLVDMAESGATELAPMEARVRCKDGSSKFIEFHLALVGDAHLVSFVDLTVRKQVEAALRESESNFRLVAETAACGIWILQDDKFAYLNRQIETITGYSREEIQAMSPWQLVHPDFRPVLQSRAKSRQQTGNLLSHFQYKILTKCGEERWLELTDSPMQFQGRPAILATAFDVTATKCAELELQERTMYLESLIANSPLGIVVKDESQRVLFCNPAFERMFLYTQVEIQGRDLDDFIAPPHAREEALRLSNSVKSGGVAHATAQRARKDGTLLDVELHGVRVYSGAKFVASFVIYQDITDRIKSEEKLQALRSRLARAQEEERARIARDLHDDTGQRLALLNIDLEQLKQTSLNLKSSLSHQLEALAKAASEITSDIYNVSRRLHPSQVDLLGLPTALSNFCRDFSASNSMEVEFVSSELLVKPPPEASLCLYRVAQEAVRNVQKHSGCSRALVQLDEVAGSLRLRVSDQGAGFAPDSPNASQGLGLLSMEERLHSMGGELFLHSRPGGGTCVEACIPFSPTVPA